MKQILIRHASFKRFFFVCLFFWFVFVFFVFFNDYGAITATIERNIIQKSKKKKCDVEFEDITLYVKARRMNSMSSKIIIKLKELKYNGFINFFFVLSCSDLIGIYLYICMTLFSFISKDTWLLPICILPKNLFMQNSSFFNWLIWLRG